MGLPFGLRFDFRNPGFADVTHADRYNAALEMAEWAEQHGCLVISVSEHHVSEDGYIPSPLVVLSAMAARTSTVQLAVTALVAPFYDPIRLAEDVIVLDHLSRGRISLVVGAGYVPDEFELYGVEMSERVGRVSEVVTTLKSALAGEPFSYRGRTVRLHPEPYRQDLPVLLGGSSVGAARRAARIADGFVATSSQTWEAYRQECQALGKPDPGPSFPAADPTVVLADDVEQGWDRVGPFFLHENNSYADLQAVGGIDSPYRYADGAPDLRATGAYAVLTPDEYIVRLKAQDNPFPHLHPMCGGIPIDLAWESLHLFGERVLPAFA